MVYTTKTPQASISVSGDAIQFKYGQKPSKSSSGMKTVVRQSNPSKRKAIK
jgi:hypothetical protein